MKILITGANGFIGKYLMEYFQASGHDVIGMVRTLKKDNDERYFACDLKNEICENITPELIIHTAARTSLEGNRTIEDFLYDNIIATSNLIHFAREKKVKGIIYLGTVSAYGIVEGKVLKEESHHIDMDDYGLTKYVAEKLIRVSGLPNRILILPAVIGKGCRDAWLMKIAKKLYYNEKVNFYNKQGKFNNIVYVKDIADFIQTMNWDKIVDSQTFLLGAADTMVMQEMIALLKERLHSKSKIYGSDDDENAFYLDCRKAIAAGYRGSTMEEMLEIVCNEISEL